MNETQVDLAATEVHELQEMLRVHRAVHQSAATCESCSAVRVEINRRVMRQATKR